jgi:16S rRNA processing protein RimM
VPRLQASPLKSGDYYIADLVGCDLTWHGERIGSVLSILESGEASLLEIGLSAGRKVLVPFRKEFIGAVDTKNRNLELLVDWILE